MSSPDPEPQQSECKKENEPQEQLPSPNIDPSKVTVNLVADPAISEAPRSDMMAPMEPQPVPSPSVPVPVPVSTPVTPNPEVKFEVTSKDLEKLDEMKLVDVHLPPELVFPALLNKNNGDHALLARKLYEWYTQRKYENYHLRDRLKELVEVKAVVPPLKEGQILVLKTKHTAGVRKAIAKATDPHRKKTSPLYLLLSEDDEAYIVDDRTQIKILKNRSKNNPPPVAVLPETESLPHSGVGKIE